MLVVNVLQHQINGEECTVVVVMPAVGVGVSGQHLLRNAFKMFQTVNGFIQKILVISKHFNLKVDITYATLQFLAQASLAKG